MFGRTSSQFKISEKTKKLHQHYHSVADPIKKRNEERLVRMNASQITDSETQKLELQKHLNTVSLLLEDNQKALQELQNSYFKFFYANRIRVKNVEKNALECLSSATTLNELKVIIDQQKLLLLKEGPIPESFTQLFADVGNSDSFRYALLMS